MMGRAITFLYGIACYVIFFLTFLYLVGFLSNLFVPRSIDVGPPAATLTALTINFALIALFGIQHTVMARPAFTRTVIYTAWTQYRRWENRRVREVSRRETRLFVASCLFAASLVANTVVSASVIHCVDSGLSNGDWVKKYYSSSAFVVLAEVTDSREIPPPTRPASVELVSMKELLDEIREGQKKQYFRYEAVLLADKIWKGTYEPRLRVYYNAWPGQHGFKLPVGERFLIFGYKLADGRYSIATICDQTVPVERAAEKIEVLDELISKEPLDPND